VAKEQSKPKGERGKDMISNRKSPAQAWFDIVTKSIEAAREELRRRLNAIESRYLSVRQAAASRSRPPTTCARSAGAPMPRAGRWAPTPSATPPTA